MSCFNAIGRKSFEKGVTFTVHIEPAPRENCGARTWNWIKWGLGLPFNLAHKVYTTCLFAKHKELFQPLQKNVNYSSLINTAPLFGDAHPLVIIANPQIMQAFLRYPRSQAGGILEDRDNAEVFIKLFEDLFPSEKISRNDFLFTCDGEHVKLFRSPILNFIGATSAKKHETQIQDIVDASLSSIHASLDSLKDFTGNFSTQVILRILFGFDEYSLVHAQEVYTSLHMLNKFIMLSRWNRKMGHEDQAAYSRAKDIIHRTIQTALRIDSPFISALKEGWLGLTHLQVKTTIILMLMAGTQTAADLLRYMLWRLGKSKDHQEKVRVSSDFLDSFRRECLRLMPPAYIIGRCAAQDLLVTLKGSNGAIQTFKINQGQKILLSPALAALHPSLHPQPDEFRPERDQTSQSWAPFGGGAHLCPGQAFATREIDAFVTSFVSKFEFTSFPEKRELSKKRIYDIRL